jgi:hypothetical protein
MVNIISIRISVLMILWLSPYAAVGQTDQERSSRREAEAIKAIEAAGGRVSRISAVDESREISCYLATDPIKDDHLKQASAIKNVIWMNLAGTEITDAGLKFIADMPLEKLHLERTQISDAGLQHLKNMKRLTYLNVYDTKVTDAGLQYLKELKSLKKLYVWKTSVTEDGMKKLNESLPELQIVGEVKLEPVVTEDPKEKAADSTKKKSKKKNQSPDKSEGRDRADNEAKTEQAPANPGNSDKTKKHEKGGS